MQKRETVVLWILLLSFFDKNKKVDNTNKMSNSHSNYKQLYILIL